MAADLLTLPLDVALGRAAASAGTASQVIVQGMSVASIAAANVASSSPSSSGWGACTGCDPGARRSRCR
jgi:hypothetical protein